MMRDNIYACILYYILLLSFITTLALVQRERPFTDTYQLNIDEFVELIKRSITQITQNALFFQPILQWHNLFAVTDPS